VAVEQVPWDDPRAVALRARLDDDLRARYAARMATRTPQQVQAVWATLQVDPDDVLATVLVLGEDGSPAAHGALRDLRGDWEVKRVIVDPAHRGRGLARLLMSELEGIARAQGAERLILQVGDQQPEAIALYEALGWTAIATYEPYGEAIPTSRCFERRLDP
jgi:GNAT superfamily N-acetyltransferase